MSDRPAILVAGATGRQGGAVVDHLLGDGGHDDRPGSADVGSGGPVDVRALTRDAGSDAARRLAARGATVVEGDLTDRAAVDDALAGADGLFLVTVGGPDAERRQGRVAVDAAVAAGVDRIVYSSGGGADRRPGIPHVDAKADVEAHLREAAAGDGSDGDDSGETPTWTILAPHTFASNFERRRDEIRAGRLAFPLASGRRLPLVDPDDVGRVAARAFAGLAGPGGGGSDDTTERDPLAGVRLELAGGAYALEEIADAFARALGRPVEATSLGADAVPSGMARFVDWMAGLDVEGVPERVGRVAGVRPRTLPEYLRRAGWGDDGGDAAGPEDAP